MKRILEPTDEMPRRGLKNSASSTPEMEHAWTMLDLATEILRKEFPLFTPTAAYRAALRRRLYGQRIFVLPIRTRKCRCTDFEIDEWIAGGRLAIVVKQCREILRYVREDFPDEFSDDLGTFVLSDVAAERPGMAKVKSSHWLLHSAPGLSGRPLSRLRVFVWGKRHFRIYHPKEEIDEIQRFVEPQHATQTSSNGESEWPSITKEEMGVSRDFLLKYAESSDPRGRSKHKKILVLCLADQEHSNGRLIRARREQYRKGTRTFWRVVYSREDWQTIKHWPTKTRRGWLTRAELSDKYPAVVAGGGGRLYHWEKSGELKTDWQIFAPGRQRQKIFWKAHAKKLNKRMSLPRLGTEGLAIRIGGKEWGPQAELCRRLEARGRKFTRHEVQLLVSSKRIESQKDTDGNFRPGKNGPIHTFNLGQADDIAAEIKTDAGPSCSSVTWRDRSQFDFTVQQAAIVKFLRAQPGMTSSANEIARHLQSLQPPLCGSVPNFSVPRAFRKRGTRQLHPAFGKLIVGVQGERGHFRLDW
jgi:hypothetical protein